MALYGPTKSETATLTVDGQMNKIHNSNDNGPSQIKLSREKFSLTASFLWGPFLSQCKTKIQQKSTTIFIVGLCAGITLRKNAMTRCRFEYELHICSLRHRHFCRQCQKKTAE